MQGAIFPWSEASITPLVQAQEKEMCEDMDKIIGIQHSNHLLDVQGWELICDHNISYEVRGIGEEAVSGKMQLIPWRAGTIGAICGGEFFGRRSPA